MDNFQKMKEDIKEDEKVHGPAGAGFITLNQTLEKVGDLINAVWACGPQLWGAIEAGVNGDRMFFKTSKSLNKKLKDVPENKAVWDKIYKETPRCFLNTTIRVYNPMDENDGNTGIIVLPDLSSKGEKEAKEIMKQLEV